MGTLFGFVVGYVIGSRAGSESFDRVEQAVRDIRDSDEFRRLVDVLKEHAKDTVRILNDRLQQGGLPAFEDLAAQARTRFSGGAAGK